MDLHARQSVKFPLKFFADAPRRKQHLRAAMECRQCGDPIYIPEWSEWLDAGHARHLWQCEACGYAFETTVYFAAA